MIAKPRLLSLVTLLIIGVSATGLRTLRAAVRLGNPGVKLSSIPVLDEHNKVARTNSVALPVNVPGFDGRLASITRLELDYLPPDTTYARRLYTIPSEQFAVQASAVLMGTDRTSIHRPEYCLTGQGWNIVRQTVTNIQIGGTKPFTLPVQRYDLTFQGEVNGRPAVRSGVFVFWFVTEGQTTASHFERQWSLIINLLTKQTLQRWAYISYFADCAPGQEDVTFQRIGHIAAATVPEFQLTSGATP
jgi:hypothetical protein